mmetsp:Transcript_5153/g.15357  ORF Transcript_5153/g.15357 Transcript_5153/m.15357 type:complete len:203 (+) Transcript_5153:198-806(+)
MPSLRHRPLESRPCEENRRIHPAEAKRVAQRRAQLGQRRAARRARLARQDVLEGGRGRLGGGKVCRRRHAPRGEREHREGRLGRARRSEQVAGCPLCRRDKEGAAAGPAALRGNRGDRDRLGRVSGRRRCRVCVDVPQLGRRHVAEPQRRLHRSPRAVAVVGWRGDVVRLQRGGCRAETVRGAPRVSREESESRGRREDRER